MFCKQLTVSAALCALVVAGCSSTPVKETSAPQPQPSHPATAPSRAPATQAVEDVTPRAAAINPLTDPNNILSQRSIYFDLNLYEVTEQYRPLVRAHSKYLIEHPEARVMVTGSADDRGSREYNLALGQRRSAAVKKVMQVYGAPGARVETVSYGEDKPVCTTTDEACRAKNRRADIIYNGE